MASPETVETILQKTAPGSSDRLLTKLFIEADGNARTAFEIFVAEHPPEDHLWFVFLWQVFEGLSPNELRSLAEEPVRLRSVDGPFHR